MGVISAVVVFSLLMGDRYAEAMTRECPPSIPNLQAIFANSLRLMQELRELHEKLKKEGSESIDGNKKNCSCGYEKYLEIESFNEFDQKRCHTEEIVESHCPVITTRVADRTTVEEIIVTLPPAISSSSLKPRRTHSSSTRVEPSTPKLAPPKTPSPSARTTISLPVSLGTVETDAHVTTAAYDPGASSQNQNEGIDIVLISVLGGVIAFLIIVMAVFICRSRIKARNKSQLKPQRSDKRPLTARSVSMISEPSLYDNGSMSAEEFVIRNSASELENGSLNGYVISKWKKEQADVMSQASMGASSTRTLIQRENDMGSPTPEHQDGHVHYDTLKALEHSHALVFGGAEYSTDKTLTLKKKKKGSKKSKEKPEPRKYREKRRSWGSSSSAASSKKGCQKQRDGLAAARPGIQETRFGHEEDDLDDNVFMNASFVGDACSSFKRRRWEANNNMDLSVTNTDDADIGPDGRASPTLNSDSLVASSRGGDDNVSTASLTSQSRASDNQSMNTAESIVLTRFSEVLNGYESDTPSGVSMPSVVSRAATSGVSYPGGYATMPHLGKDYPDPPAQFRDPEPHVAVVRPSAVKKTGQWPSGHISPTFGSTPDISRSPSSCVTRITIGNGDVSPQSQVALSAGELAPGFTTIPSSFLHGHTAMLANGKPMAHVPPTLQGGSTHSLDKPAPIDVKL